MLNASPLLMSHVYLAVQVLSAYNCRPIHNQKVPTEVQMPTASAQWRPKGEHIDALILEQNFLTFHTERFWHPVKGVQIFLIFWGFFSILTLWRLTSHSQNVRNIRQTGKTKTYSLCQSAITLWWVLTTQSGIGAPVCRLIFSRNVSTYCTGIQSPLNYPPELFCINLFPTLSW